MQRVMPGPDPAIGQEVAGVLVELDVMEQRCQAVLAVVRDGWQAAETWLLLRQAMRSVSTSPKEVVMTEIRYIPGGQVPRRRQAVLLRRGRPAQRRRRPAHVHRFLE